MPNIATGPRVQINYIPETEAGVTPANPTLRKLRATSRSINLEKGLLESQEPTQNRNKQHQRHGFHQIAGSPGFELAQAAHDDFLEAAVSGTLTDFTAATGTLDTSGTTPVFTGSGFVAAGLRPGDVVGNAGNLYRVITVTDTSIQLSVGTPSNLPDVPAGSLKIIGRRMDQGVDLKTFTMERHFPDVGKFQVFRGVAVNTMQLNIQPEQLVGGTMNLVGMSGGISADESVSAQAAVNAPLTDPMTSFDGVLYEGGERLAVCTGLDFTIDNGRTLQGVVGSRFSPCVFEGISNITGNLTAFFSDARLIRKFEEELESSIWIRVDAPDGVNFINLVFHRVKFNTANIDPPLSGPVVVPLAFTALAHPVYDTTLSVQVSNAAS